MPDQTSMLSNSNDPSSSQIDKLHDLKRRIYLAAISVGTLALLGSWGFKFYAEQLETFEKYIFPIISIYCLILIGVLVWERQSVRLVEALLFAGTALSLLARLFDILFVSINPDDPLHTLAFTDLFYWFPLVYVLAFIIFESQKSLLAGSILFFALSLAMGIVYGVQGIRAGENFESIYLLGRFYSANLTYIVLLVVGIRLNRQYLHAKLETEKMTYLANTDHLMDIANRRQLDDAVAEFIARAQRYGEQLSAIMFDLDDFKNINDTYGHEAGDIILREVAQIAKAHLRATDLAGRWGGEEFLIIVPKSGENNARELAERLRLAIESHEFERKMKLTASFGVSEYQAGEPLTEWMKRTDEALYLSKKNGRNRVSVVD